MKRLLGVLAFSVAACAAPVLVQQKTATAPDGDAFGNMTSPTTAGNTVIALISCLSTDSIISVTQGVDTLTAGPSATVSGITSSIYYLQNVTGGNAAFEVQTLASLQVSVNVSEWSGLTTNAPVTNTNTGTASATVTTGSVTPATANNLVIAIGGWTANDYSSGPTNSFTRMTQTGGTGAFQEGAYLIQSSATSASTGWTLTAGINWAAAIAAFRAPASGPTNAQRSAGFWSFP